MKGKEVEYFQDSKTMFEIDLRAEQETIKKQRESVKQKPAGEFALSKTLRNSRGTGSRNRSERCSRTSLVKGQRMH